MTQSVADPSAAVMLTYLVIYAPVQQSVPEADSRKGPSTNDRSAVELRSNIEVES